MASQNIGDAVLRFLADTTSLDAAVARINAETAAKLEPAGAAVTKLSEGFDAAGKSATSAGESIKAASASTVQAASNAELLAQKLIAEGVSAKDATGALVKLGFAQKEAAAAATAAATAATNAGNAIAAAAPKAATLGTAGANAGKSLADAFGLIPPTVAKSDGALQNMAFALRGVGASGSDGLDKVNHAAKEAAKQLQEATATAGLFSEATGITLPRHVRNFIAALPGLGAALSAAFSAAAILFVIEAIISAGEKIEELIEKPRALEEAWADVADASAEAGHTMEEALNAAEAKIIETTDGPLAAMDFKIQHLGTSAKQVAGLIGNMGEELTKALEAQETSKFNLLSAFIDNSREITTQSKRFFEDLGHAINQLGNTGGLVLVKAQLGEVDAEIKKTNTDLDRTAAQIGTLSDILKGRPAEAQNDIFKSRIDSLNRYKDTLLDVEKVAQHGIDLDKANAQAAVNDRRRLAGELQAQQEKRNLDLTLAYIEQRRVAEHAAFVNGETDAATWAVAQLRAINDSTAAHEVYLGKIVTIYRNSGDVVKSQAAAQDLATSRVVEASKQQELLTAATEKYHTATRKILTDWQELQNNAVAKNFEEAQKAAERLTQAELKLGEAQKNLQQTQIGVDFSAQENAIERLADFAVISETQKAQRLSALYRLEEQQALSSLQRLQQQQKDAVDAAQTKFDAGKSNPLLTDSQIRDLQINLDRMKTLQTNTQAEILKTEADFDQKRLALDRGFFAESVALAIAAGNDDLAAGLLATRAHLDATDAQIREKEAVHENTAALRAQRAEYVASLSALEAHASALEDVASGNDTLSAKFGRFLTNFQRGDALTRLFDKDLHSTSQGMRTFGAVATFVADTFGSAWQSAIAGAILGQESFGNALRKSTAQVAAQIAAQALLYGAFYLAQGIADVFWNPARAAADFTSAAQFFALAGAAAGVAIAINPKKEETDTGGDTGRTTERQGAQIPEQQPVQTVNFASLYGGGLITKRTRAIVGDSLSGGDQREAVLPLGSDTRALDEIGRRLFDHMQIGSGGGDTHYHIRGDLIDHNRLMRKQSQMAKKGKGRLTVNNSFALTRRK